MLSRYNVHCTLETKSDKDKLGPLFSLLTRRVLERTNPVWMNVDE